MLNLERFGAEVYPFPPQAASRIIIAAFTIDLVDHRDLESWKNRLFYKFGVSESRTALPIRAIQRPNNCEELNPS